MGTVPIEPGYYWRKDEQGARVVHVDDFKLEGVKDLFYAQCEDFGWLPVMPEPNVIWSEKIEMPESMKGD
jgi:hypothetical protein